MRQVEGHLHLVAGARRVGRGGGRVCLGRGARMYTKSRLVLKENQLRSHGAALMWSFLGADDVHDCMCWSSVWVFSNSGGLVRVLPKKARQEGAVASGAFKS